MMRKFLVMFSLFLLLGVVIKIPNEFDSFVDFIVKTIQEFVNMIENIFYYFSSIIKFGKIFKLVEINGQSNNSGET